MAKHVNRKTIEYARELGYLIATPEAKAEQREWMRIAGDEMFPFAMVALRRTGRRVDIRVAWEVIHLGPGFAEQARAMTQAAAAAHPGAAISDGGETFGGIRGLPLAAAKDLASQIVALPALGGAES